MMSGKQEIPFYTALQQLNITKGQIFVEPDETLRTLTREFAGLLEVERVSVWRFNLQLDEMRLVQAYQQMVDEPVTGQIHKLRDFPAFLSAIQEGKPFSAEDIRTDPKFSELLMEYWLLHEIRSAIVIPLRWDGSLRAAVFFEHPGPQRQWSAGDVEKASRLTVPLVRLMQIAELNEAADVLDAIREIQTCLIRRGDLQEGLQLIIERGSQLIQASAGMSFLREPGQQAVRCVVSYQTRTDWTGQLHRPGDGPPAAIAMSGRSLVLSDYLDWAGGEDVFEEEQIASLLCLPMNWKGENVGAILFFSREDDRPLGMDDLELLEPLVTQAAAVTQIDRFQDKLLRAQALQEALRGIGAISEAVSSTIDLLRSSLEHGCRALRTSIGIAALDGHISTVGYAARTGYAVIDLIRESGLDLTNIRAVEDWQQAPAGTAAIAADVARFGLKTTLIVQLRTGERERGILIFGAPNPRVWLEDEIAMVEVASELISASAERIEAMRAMSDQRDLLRVLETTSNGLNYVRGYSDTLSMVGEGAMSLGKTYRAAMFMKQRNGAVFIPWMNGLTRLYADRVMAQEASAFTRLFDIPSTVMIHRDSISAQEAALGKLLQADPFQAIGLWPMVYDERNVAVMACYYDSPPYLKAIDHEVMQIFLRQATAALENSKLYEKLENQYIQTALTLAKAVDDSEVEQTDRNILMADLARATARQMGVSERELEAIYWAALLHDIGKAGVPKSVLNKAEPLEPQEWSVLHQVPLDGERFLGGIEHFRGASRLVRHFREHYDGSGYPDRLRGEQIPLGARILAVADAYQAMVGKRPYREPRTHEQAVAELQRMAGKQFDPRVVVTFLQSARHEPGVELVN